MNPKFNMMPLTPQKPGIIVGGSSMFITTTAAPSTSNDQNPQTSVSHDMLPNNNQNNVDSTATKEEPSESGPPLPSMQLVLVPLSSLHMLNVPLIIQPNGVQAHTSSSLTNSKPIEIDLTGEDEEVIAQDKAQRPDFSKVCDNLENEKTCRSAELSQSNNIDLSINLDGVFSSPKTDININSELHSSLSNASLSSEDNKDYKNSKVCTNVDVISPVEPYNDIKLDSMEVDAMSPKSDASEPQLEIDLSPASNDIVTSDEESSECIMSEHSQVKVNYGEINAHTDSEFNQSNENASTETKTIVKTSCNSYEKNEETFEQDLAFQPTDSNILEDGSYTVKSIGSSSTERENQIVDEASSPSGSEVKKYVDTDNSLGEDSPKEESLNCDEDSEIKIEYPDCIKGTERTKEFQCNLCPYETDEVVNMEVHRKTHRNVIICSQCPYITCKSQKMQLHVQAKHTPKEDLLYYCGDCDFTSMTRIGLVKHRRCEHERCRTKLVPILKTCPLCPYECSSEQEMKHHQKKKHNTQCYPCSKCYQVFTTPKAINRHYLSHTYQRLGPGHFKCLECDFVGPQHSMINHYNVEHREKIHCEQCSYTTNFKMDLQKHVKTQHSKKDDGEMKPKKRFSCEHCPYSSNFKCHLQRHVKTLHTEKKDCGEMTK